MGLKVCSGLCVVLASVLAVRAGDVEMRTGTVFGEPVVIASEPAEGMGLAREGTKLYTGAKGVLRVYETAGDALHPRLLGQVEVPNGAAVRQLAVRDALVGISAREGQVMFFDFRDPARPRFLSRFDCCELATGIDFGGDVCFCGQRNYGVEFIDVRDPAHPAHIAMRKTDESQSVVYRDGYCYSGEWGTGHVTVFDCRDMSKIAQTAYEELHGVGDGVWLDGDLLFAATGHHSKHRPTAGLRTFEPEDLKKYSLGRKIEGAGAGHGMDVFSVADPAHPKHLGRVDYPPYYSRGNDFWTARASGVKGLVFAAQAYNGLFAVDVSNPAAPQVRDRFVLPCATRAGAPSAVIGAIAVGDGVVYVAAHEHGILAVPAKGAKPQDFNRGAAPKHPEFREPYPNDDARFACWLPETRGQVRGVAVKGDLVYAACGDAGLYALRVKDDTLETIRRVPGVAQAYDVDLKGDRLVAAEGLRGWAFYRIGAEGELTETARIRRSPEGKNFGFWAWMLSERWIVLSPRNGRYLLVDAEDAAHPKTKAILPMNAPGWSKYLPDRLVQGRWLCWNMGNTAAAWVDVTAPTTGRDQMPVVQSEPKYRGGPTSGCCALGDKVLFMRGDSFSLYSPGEFSDEVVPLKTPDAEFGKSRGFPRSDGRYLLVCDRVRRKAAFFDMVNPKKPKCLWYEKFSGNPDCGVVSGGRAFIPCGYQGLLMTREKSVPAN